MFSLMVKRGSEAKVVTRLMRKYRRLKLDGVASITTVSKAPGRIYVEAHDLASLRSLCEGMDFIYITSTFVVPPAERVALLVPNNTTRSLIGKGELVKIRNELYRGDTGIVIDLLDGYEMLVLKVKSREPHPEDLQETRREKAGYEEGLTGSMAKDSSTTVLVSKSTGLKRKRIVPSRRHPYLLDRKYLRMMAERHREDVEDGRTESTDVHDVALNFKDLDEDGFLYRTKRYTVDGYLLLEVRYDRVERIKQSVEQRKALVHCEEDWIEHTKRTLKHSLDSGLLGCQLGADDEESLLQADVSTFIHVGDSVRVTGGSSAGVTGRLVELTSTESAIDLDLSSTPQSSTNNSTKGRIRTCSIDHFEHGFEGETVYGWRGPFKGRFGTVIRTSGALAELGVESAVFGDGTEYINSSQLVAECTCVLSKDAELPWTKEEIARIPLLFRQYRMSVRCVGGSNDFCAPSSGGPGFHDPNGEGMWLFHKEVAQVRKEYDLILSIVSHRDTSVSGRCNGRVLSCENPLSHPIPLETPTTVLVKRTDGKGGDLTESLEVSTLRPRLRTHGTNVVVAGKKIGMIVHHIRTDGDDARVFPDGSDKKKAAFNLKKNYVCAAEKKQCGF